MTSSSRYIRAGRWVIVATQIAMALVLLMIVFLAVYSKIIGSPRLQIPEPWNAIAFYAVFVPWIAIVLCWFVFCVFYARLLRRRSDANSFDQLVAIFSVVVPVWGLRFYDRTVRGNERNDDDGVKS